MGKKDEQNDTVEVPATGENVEMQVIDAADLPRAPLATELQTHDVADTSYQEVGQAQTTQLPKGDSSVLGTSDVPGIQGEQYVASGGVELSNNAVTAQARAALVDNPVTYRVENLGDLSSESALFAAITLVSGTTKIKAGKLYTAIKSTVFSAPGGRGTRAAVVTKDGTMELLSNGTNYNQWYERITEMGGAGLIFRFDQSLEDKNPYVQCDIYTLKALPKPSVSEDTSVWG